MPKSYSQFKYTDVLELGLSLTQIEFIKNIEPLEPSNLLKQILALNTERFHNTEKAKSEFIIAPILNEIAHKNVERISFFSGNNLDVDKERGLKGFCDFLFIKTPRLPFIKDPIFCIAEAKKDDPATGIPQCIAEMYAARLFNERQGKSVPIIFGCSTTGYLWQFLKIEGQTAYQDTAIYSLSDLPQILGILQFIVEG
jgi:hypothetical protein